ncbi:MAG: phage virion morphogenesis protein [Paraburkholderia tropica]|uniref:phage virion morphogenesis protein n=1 Tax=Paraburkholderia tropica TaxID=92647 RepID=UPI0031013FC8
MISLRPNTLAAVSAAPKPPVTVEAKADGLALGFAGRVARIARVHQLGELASGAPCGPNVQYPARRLLGFTDVDLIRHRPLHHITQSR